jgi:hypothetical protein
MFHRNGLPPFAGWLIMGHVDGEVIGKKRNYHLYGKFELPGTSTKNLKVIFEVPDFGKSETSYLLTNKSVCYDVNISLLEIPHGLHSLTA